MRASPKIPFVALSGKLGRPVLILPSLVTVGSLFAGFLSIISAIKGNYELSVKYIALSFILDGLDGRVARKFNAISSFGKEFDSLCDLVAFGVAPSLLIWSWAFSAEMDELGVLASFLFIAGGAIRLARFNISATTEAKSYFIGLPIPAAACCLASLVYAYPKESPTFLISVLVLIYVTALALCMVSTFKYESFKKFRVKGIDPMLLVLCLSILVTLVWKFDRVSIPIILLIYALSGPFTHFRSHADGELIEHDPDEEDDRIEVH